MNQMFEIQIQCKDSDELLFFFFFKKRPYNKSHWQMGRLFSYLVADKILVFVTVNLPVLLKHTVLDTRTHEVEIALAGCKAATHSGSRLPTMVTALETKETEHVNHINQSNNLFSRQFITSPHYPGTLTR